MWCLVSDKPAIPLHDKKPGGIMMRQNYKKRGCMLKTTDENNRYKPTRVCHKSVTHPLCMDKAGMLNINLHITDY